jgi:hypothetical protein
MIELVLPLGLSLIDNKTRSRHNGGSKGWIRE